MRNKIEVIFWKIAKRILYKGYGANCPTKDTEDFGEGIKVRCGSCHAQETIEWIDLHIKLLKDK